MDTADIQRLRGAVQARLDALVAAGDDVVQRDLDTPVASAADQDEAPYREMEQALASNRNRERAALIQQIQGALRRLDEAPASFGECEDCDQGIPVRRLELMPWTTLCVRCQEARDGERGPARRRKVTDYT